jgi:hypothetical protein
MVTFHQPSQMPLISSSSGQADRLEHPEPDEMRRGQPEQRLAVFFHPAAIRRSVSSSQGRISVCLPWWPPGGSLPGMPRPGARS